MNTMEQQAQTPDLQALFAALPPIIQDSITSADVEAHLRALSDTHQLHIDQWVILENTVMLSLLGVTKIEGLAHEIETKVGIEAKDAALLAGEISTIIFDPIRGEIEAHMQKTRSIIPESPKEKVVPIDATSTTYLAQVPSHERKNVDGDPYREQVS